MNRWLVFRIGCLECDEPSSVVGTYASREEADSVAQQSRDDSKWHERLEFSFEVFDLGSAK